MRTYNLGLLGTGLKIFASMLVFAADALLRLLFYNSLLLLFAKRRILPGTFCQSLCLV